MGSRVQIRLFHILHFVRDLLFPLLKNSKSGVHDRGHCFGSGSPVTIYPPAKADGLIGSTLSSQKIKAISERLRFKLSVVLK